MSFSSLIVRGYSDYIVSAKKDTRIEDARCKIGERPRRILGVNIFGPVIDGLATFDEVGITALTERLEEVQIGSDACSPAIHFPITEAKLIIRCFSKYPGGKIEFSRWITSGLSPFSRRNRSSRREAIFSAARLFRLILVGGFIWPNDLSRGGENGETLSES